MTQGFQRDLYNAKIQLLHVENALKKPLTMVEFSILKNRKNRLEKDIKYAEILIKTIDNS